MAMQTARFLENYNRLKAVLGEEQTQVLTSYFADQFDETRKEQEMQVATKIDLANLKIELSEKISDSESRLSAKISDSESRLSAKISDSEMKLSAKISDNEIKLSAKISDSKVDSIRWIVALMITQTGLLTGIIFAILKHWL